MRSIFREMPRGFFSRNLSISRATVGVLTSTAMTFSSIIRYEFTGDVLKRNTFPLNGCTIYASTISLFKTYIVYSIMTLTSQAEIPAGVMQGEGFTYKSFLA